MKKYYNPVKLIETEDWKTELLNYISISKMKSVVFVTSPGNRNRLNLDKLFSQSTIYEFKGSNPTINDCLNSIKFFQNKSFDCLVSIGGGSVMDLSKFIKAYLCLKIEDPLKIINYNEIYPRSLPMVFIPTTHGTGSEVTMWGTIWDLDNNIKKSISNISLYPDVGIIDGDLTLSLPMDISINTTLDALSHSFESIWNKNANLKSTNFAIKSISLILNNFDKLIDKPNDLRVRSELLKASAYAGLAFSNTQTAAAHSISYPLTIFFGIAHGIASSITLAELLKMNHRLINNDLDKICNLVGLNSFDQLFSKIEDLVYQDGKHRLRNFGIKKSDISWLKDKCFTKERMKNSIININANHVNNILLNIY